MSDEVGGMIAKFFLGLLMLPLLALLSGFAVSILWRWFVVPLGVPEIGLAHGYGLALMVGMLTPSRTSDEDKKGFFEKVAIRVAFVGFGLLLGWVAWGLMP